MGRHGLMIITCQEAGGERKRTPGAQSQRGGGLEQEGLVLDDVWALVLRVLGQEKRKEREQQKRLEEDSRYSPNLMPKTDLCALITSISHVLW